MSAQPDTQHGLLLELLKAKKEEGRGLVLHYVRAGMFYVVLTGGLLKFAFDANATPQLKDLLLVFGIVLAVFGALMSLFGEFLRRRMEADIRDLCRQIGAPALASDLLALKISAYLFLVLVVAAFAGWVYLFSTGGGESLPPCPPSLTADGSG